MPISGRAISDRPISGDADDPEAQQGKFKRQFRTTMRAPIYEPPDEMPGAEPEPAEVQPTPTYDALKPEQQAVVDRIIVGARLLSMRGVA